MVKSCIIALTLALLLFPYSMASANCEEDVFAYVEFLLADSDPLSLSFTEDELTLNLQRAAEFGISVPETFMDHYSSAKTLYKYDWCMDLIETQFGSYFTWTIEQRHCFDQLMVKYGQLDACFNLLPDEGDLNQTEAIALAKEIIVARFDLSADELSDCNVAASYVSLSLAPKGTWRFAFFSSDGLDNYQIELSNAGKVLYCEKNPGRSRFTSTDDYYSSLTDEKGAFFRWSLEDKAWLSALLPDLIAEEKRNGNEVLPEVQAIADYQFCLPTSDSITQEEAKKLALSITQEEFSLPDGWDASFDVHYSFFPSNHGGFTWRVLFWQSSVGSYYGSLVELDAYTGDVTKILGNGNTFDTSIPYVDRL